MSTEEKETFEFEGPVAGTRTTMTIEPPLHRQLASAKEALAQERARHQAAEAELRGEVERLRAERDSAIEERGRMKAGWERKKHRWRKLCERRDANEAGLRNDVRRAEEEYDKAIALAVDATQERDARGDILNDIQAAAGCGLWRGAIEVIATERAAREKAEAERDHAIEMEARAVLRAERAAESQEEAEMGRAALHATLQESRDEYIAERRAREEADRMLADIHGQVGVRGDETVLEAVLRVLAEDAAREWRAESERSAMGERMAAAMERYGEERAARERAERRAEEQRLATEDALDQLAASRRAHEETRRERDEARAKLGQAVVANASLETQTRAAEATVGRLTEALRQNRNTAALASPMGNLARSDALDTIIERTDSVLDGIALASVAPSPHGECHVRPCPTVAVEPQPDATLLAKYRDLRSTMRHLANDVTVDPNTTAAYMGFRARECLERTHLAAGEPRPDEPEGCTLHFRMDPDCVDCCPQPEAHLAISPEAVDEVLADPRNADALACAAGEPPAAEPPDEPSLDAALQAIRRAHYQLQAERTRANAALAAHPAEEPAPAQTTDPSETTDGGE